MRHLVDHGSDGLVVCGTTGEASTLSDDEQLRMIELAVAEVGDRATVVAGAGSNDTRHAVHLTERATELGADAILSVTPYYNRPSRKGLVRHYEEVARATDRPIVLYNIPARTGTDMPNDLLAELAQIEHIEAVKQSNPDNLALVDGLDVYAGNDDDFLRTLELGGAGGILVAAHLVGEDLRRMVDEPDRRAEIDEGLRDVYEALAVGPLASSTEGGAEPAGPRGRRPAPAAGGAGRERAGGAPRDAGAPRPAGHGRLRERHPAHPAARRAGRDRQEHDRRRVRRAASWSSTSGCASRPPT